MIYEITGSAKLNFGENTLLDRTSKIPSIFAMEVRFQTFGVLTILTTATIERSFSTFNHELWSEWLQALVSCEQVKWYKNYERYFYFSTGQILIQLSIHFRIGRQKFLQYLEWKCVSKFFAFWQFWQQQRMLLFNFQSWSLIRETSGTRLVPTS